MINSIKRLLIFGAIGFWSCLPTAAQADTYKNPPIVIGNVYNYTDALVCGTPNAAKNVLGQVGAMTLERWVAALRRSDSCIMFNYVMVQMIGFIRDQEEEIITWTDKNGGIWLVVEAVPVGASEYAVRKLKRTYGQGGRLYILMKDIDIGDQTDIEKWKKEQEATTNKEDAHI